MSTSSFNLTSRGPGVLLFWATPLRTKTTGSSASFASTDLDVIGLHATHMRTSESVSCDRFRNTSWSWTLAAIHRNQSISSARNLPKVRGFSRSHTKASSVKERPSKTAIKSLPNHLAQPIDIGLLTLQLALCCFKCFPKQMCRRFRCWARVRVKVRQRRLGTAMLCAANRCLRSAA
jgi:hypothetical protein